MSYIRPCYLNVWRRAALASILCVLLGCGPSQEEVEREVSSQQSTFLPVIDTLNKYHSAHGTFPKYLSHLQSVDIPKVIAPPKLESLRPKQLTYEVSRDGSFFRVSFGLYDNNDYQRFAISAYSSIDSKWITTRNIEQMPHVEATYYGAAYLMESSKMQLDLSVQSLLDATRRNSNHGCRNLWRDWIVKALGSGSQDKVVLPGNTDEVLTYWDLKKRSGYAFAISEELYEPMTNRLKIVRAIYQITPNRDEWKLLQKCDSSNDKPEK
jgi:hypothetical protein